MANTSDVLSRLLSALTLTDPSWDVTVGSATYKILEAVAQEIATTTNNSVLQTYSYDVNSKFGSELDAFCNLFGINRQIGKRATTSVVFSTNSPATNDLVIPLGTQVYAGSLDTNISNIYFTTTSPAVIAKGEMSIEVPVISVLPGSINNVDAQAINTINSTLTGITSVSNTNPVTGGADTETDTQLQARFKATAFTNITGTSDKYTSVALQDPAVTQVNVIGAQERYREQLTVQTLISTTGAGTFTLGLKSEAVLSVTGSGAKSANLTTGIIPLNTTISGTSYISGSGVISSTGTVFYDGTTYKVTGVTGSGNIYVNYTSSATPSMSGTTTAATLQTNLTTLYSGFYNTAVTSGITATISGGATIADGIYVSTTAPTCFRVGIVTSGAGVQRTSYITSQIPDSKYTYPQGGEMVGVNLGSSSQYLLSPVTDYTYPTSTGVPLSIILLPSASNAPYTYTGNPLELESEYIPTSSRISDPAINSNIVDIFINGTSATPVTEQVVVVTGNVLNGTSGSPFNTTNFKMANGVAPGSGHWYISLSQQPVINFPAQLISGAPSYITFGNYNFPIAVNNTGTITITGYTSTSGSPTITTTGSITGLTKGLVIASGGTALPSGAPSGIPIGSYIVSIVPGSPSSITLSKNATATVTSTGTVNWASVAFPIYDVTNTAGSVNSLTAVAFKATDPTNLYGVNYPANGTIGTISYSYNNDVATVDSLQQQSRPIGTNLLVHQAQSVNLIVNLSIVYEPGYSVSIVNSSIFSSLAQYFLTIPYGNAVRLSGIVRQVLSVQGVQNVRISTSTDNPAHYGVQVVNIDGSNSGSPSTKDILLNSNQLASLYSIYITQFGQTNF